MKNKIFISHASEDVDVVESFVDKLLKLGCDISSSRIFCSSMTGHGVEGGQYIPSRIRKEIHESGIVFLFISKSYKKSEVCLNELGAAWVTLEEKNVIPILLPNVEFKEIGFFKENHLGIKLDNDVSLKQLIHEKKEALNPDYNPNILHKQVEEFCKSLNKDLSKVQEGVRTKYSEEQLEYIECFDKSLYPFHEIFMKSIPHLGDDVHHITDSVIQDRILSKINEYQWNTNLWYRMANGDMHTPDVTKIESGNWIIDIDGRGREINIEDMWISMELENQYDFILVKCAQQPPYKIDSNVGGEGYRVGILHDGRIISENEHGNGYSQFEGDVVNNYQVGVKSRFRDKKSHWIFFSTRFHKVGYNFTKVEELCDKLDRGLIEVSAENLRSFQLSLENHPTVIAHR